MFPGLLELTVRRDLKGHQVHREFKVLLDQPAQLGRKEQRVLQGQQESLHQVLLLTAITNPLPVTVLPTLPI